MKVVLLLLMASLQARTTLKIGDCRLKIHGLTIDDW